MTVQQKGRGDPSSRSQRESLLSADPRAVQASAAPLDGGGFQARYTELELLAQSRTHQVLLYSDARMRRTVALKTISPESAGDKKTRRRFLREARIQAQLQHPAIVPVYDLGVTPDGREYFTMQTVSGKGLDVVLDGLRSGDPAFLHRFSHDRLMDVFEQLCMVVDYIHERGVVHRNVCPKNVLLGDFGEVYLMDWSLARASEESSSIDADVGDATLRGRPTGTPGYASPEQLSASPNVGRRSDVYSLGAILFEMLTLEPLHRGDNPGARFQATLGGSDARASVRARHRNIPPALDVVCVEATASDPDKRYGSARELLEAVAAVHTTDRDIESRQRLAEKHAQAAESATVHAMVGTLQSEQHRRVALREAGRALALDPSSGGARRAVATLLREPPDELPEEAREAHELEQAQEISVFARYGIVAYSAFAMVAGLVAFGGVASWTGLLMILVPLAITVLLCQRLLAAPRPRPEGVLAVFVTSTLAISAASGLYGALVLVPQLVVANTLALNVTSLRRYRLPMLAGGLLAMSVPLALERTGVLPRAYDFSSAAIHIYPVVREFREVPVRFGLLVAGLAAIVAPSLYVWKAHDALTALSDSLEAHTWRLRQLLPQDADELLSGTSRARKRSRPR